MSEELTDEQKFEYRVLGIQQDFQRAVEKIINEQNSYTLCLAFKWLCRSAHKNLTSLIDGRYR